MPVSARTYAHAHPVGGRVALGHCVGVGVDSATVGVAPAAPELTNAQGAGPYLQDKVRVGVI